jgi:nicotinamidase-related amidase
MSTDPEHTALLIVDVQPPIADLGGPRLVERLADGAATARAAGVAVIYVKVGFRPGYPEIGPRVNTMFARIKEMGAFVDGVSADVHESIAPESGEIVVTSPRRCVRHATSTRHQPAGARIPGARVRACEPSSFAASNRRSAICDTSSSFL